MKIASPEKIVEELETGLGTGPLTLGIYCTKCNGQFELGRDSVAMAIITESSFLEYLRFVQSSDCPACNKD